MLSLNIPIWGKKYSAGVREAQLKRQAVLKQKGDTENQLKAQLQMASFQRRDAERKLDLYGNGLIPKAEQSLKVTEQAYRSSGGSFLDLIDAQRSLLEFQLSYERALADHEQGLARIELLIGSDVRDERSQEAIQ
jgi:outer membrane protein TolC